MGRWDYPVAFRRIGKDVCVYGGVNPHNHEEWNGGIEFKW